MNQNETRRKFQRLLGTKGREIPVEAFYEFDFSEITDEEILQMQLRLFEEDWHHEHEDLALSFQRQAHPLAIDQLYRNAFRSELDFMDYKPLARKCTWALADIGTPKAKLLLEKMADSGDEIIAGFAQKRLNNWEKEKWRKGPKIRLRSKPGHRIQLNKYVDNLKKIPKEGSHIIGHQLESDYLVVYQAYNPSIAAYAVENQQFGGKHFSMTRMSWIKPNFLWMMYRCGWAGKENQERVLAIAISKKFFKKILKQGVLSGFDENEYETREQWEEKLGKSDVRIQWDPDHDPYGAKQNWRAIQIGLRGEMLKDYCTREIYFIEDITDFVKRQKLYVDQKETDKLWIPKERVIEFPDEHVSIL